MAINTLADWNGAHARQTGEVLATKLEPGARLSVLRQLREVANNRLRDAETSTIAHPGARTFAAEGGDSNRSSPFVIAQAQPRQPAYPGQTPQTQGPRPRDENWWKQKPLLPSEEGGEAAIEPNPNGPFSRPRQDPLEETPPGYEYGAWERDPHPRTSTGSLLVSPARLTQRQRENLLGRVWIYPTERQVGGGRLEKGRGYFGADREGAGPPRHGGYDAPYKFPWEQDNDEQGKPRSRAVRLPTRSVCTGFTPKAKSGETINRLSFDLGDGLTLELLHVQLSPALDAKIKAAQRSGRPLELDAGEMLGDVDAAHDHTHVQIVASGPNGERWVVDPTYFMEKRARTFWRDPLPDSWEKWIDTGRNAVDWAQRQFE